MVVVVVVIQSATCAVFYVIRFMIYVNLAATAVRVLQGLSPAVVCLPYEDHNVSALHIHFSLCFT
jgi:hypothetical protein